MVAGRRWSGSLSPILRYIRGRWAEPSVGVVLRMREWVFMTCPRESRPGVGHNQENSVQTCTASGEQCWGTDTL